MSEDHSGSTIILERVPGYAKALILIETSLVMFFSYWFYQDYTYNIYFQAWVSNYLAENQLMLLGASTGLLAMIIAAAIFFKSRGSKNGVSHTLEQGVEPSPSSPTTAGLDHHTEQHLIDMIIRRNANPNHQPTPSSSQPTNDDRMPTLRRVDPNRRDPPSSQQ